jgi:hypothetical protein
MNALSGAAEAPTWAGPSMQLRREMDAWIASSLAMQEHVPFLGVHDEGSFVASWLAHYLLTHDGAILQFARRLRDGFAAWSEGHLHHGFAPEGEAHHQTEFFTQFLVRLWHVAPDDLTGALIADAAEHVGNWVEGIPQWYDTERNVFRAWHVGTVRTGEEGFEVPDHFRLIQLALAGFAVTQDQRYLDLSLRWVGRWAEEIVASEPEPPTSLVTGPGAVDPAVLETARGVAHAGGGRAGLVEPFVAAGAVDVLLDLYELSGPALLANAARVLCAALADEIADPYANPPGALLHRYRLVTGDTSLDRRILGALSALPEETADRMAMVLEEPSPGPVPGVGKRSDMVRWAYRDEGGGLREETCPAPSALMLAYEITGSVEYASRALELAARRLRLARQAMGDGRTHGCGGRSVSAVASGHGRDAGYGNVTGCLYPLALGATRRLGHERAAVEIPGGALAADAAMLVRCDPGQAPVGALWQDGRTTPLLPSTQIGEKP